MLLASFFISIRVNCRSIVGRTPGLLLCVSFMFISCLPPAIVVLQTLCPLTVLFSLPSIEKYSSTCKPYSVVLEIHLCLQRLNSFYVCYTQINCRLENRIVQQLKHGIWSQESFRILPRPQWVTLV